MLILTFLEQRQRLMELLSIFDQVEDSQWVPCFQQNFNESLILLGPLLFAQKVVDLGRERGHVGLINHRNELDSGCKNPQDQIGAK
jgi:hypothetical protein